MWCFNQLWQWWKKCSGYEIHVLSLSPVAWVLTHTHACMHAHKTHTLSFTLSSPLSFLFRVPPSVAWPDFFQRLLLCCGRSQGRVWGINRGAVCCHAARGIQPRGSRQDSGRQLLPSEKVTARPSGCIIIGEYSWWTQWNLWWKSDSLGYNKQWMLRAGSLLKGFVAKFYEIFSLNKKWKEY